MHGEYKVPGGKLVVADVELVEDRLAHVRISGDFFLEPPEALAAIDAALAGLAVDSDEAVIADVVCRALPADAEMFGFSAKAVAITVKRALA
jgi:hypothetical protein